MFGNSFEEKESEESFDKKWRQIQDLESKEKENRLDLLEKIILDKLRKEYYFKEKKVDSNPSDSGVQPQQELSGCDPFLDSLDSHRGVDYDYIIHQFELDLEHYYQQQMKTGHNRESNPFLESDVKLSDSIRRRAPHIMGEPLFEDIETLWGPKRQTPDDHQKQAFNEYNRKSEDFFGDEAANVNQRVYVSPPVTCEEPEFPNWLLPTQEEMDLLADKVYGLETQTPSPSRSIKFEDFMSSGRDIGMRYNSTSTLATMSESNQPIDSEDSKTDETPEFYPQLNENLANLDLTSDSESQLIEGFEEEYLVMDSFDTEPNALESSESDSSLRSSTFSTKTFDSVDSSFKSEELSDTSIRSHSSFGSAVSRSDSKKIANNLLGSQSDEESDDISSDHSSSGPSDVLSVYSTNSFSTTSKAATSGKTSSKDSKESKDSKVSIKSQKSDISIFSGGSDDSISGEVLDTTLKPIIETKTSNFETSDSVEESLKKSEEEWDRVLKKRSPSSDQIPDRLEAKN